MLRIISLSLLLCASGICEDTTYIGAEACGSCHPGQLRSQSDSGHAQALYRATEHPLAALFTPVTPLSRPPNFHFRFVMTPRGIQVQGDDSRNVMTLPVDWAFGAGAQAVTFISKVSDELHIEHSFTYYSNSRSFDITPQHARLPAATLNEVMGQAFKTQGSSPTIEACFRCHSTGPVSVSPKHEVQVTETGVRCEVCHGPGDAHSRAARRGELFAAKKTIQNPKTLSPGDLNRSCGTCHRFPDGDSGTTDWSDAWNVRHQPPYFQQSRCFQKSGNLSCLTCHNMHERLRRDDSAYYSQICSGCHEHGALAPKETCKNGAADCIGCHMPSVAISSHLRFRNHWIGVYADGATLKPVR